MLPRLLEALLASGCLDDPVTFVRQAPADGCPDLGIVVDDEDPGRISHVVTVLPSACHARREPPQPILVLAAFPVSETGNESASKIAPRAESQMNAT